MEERSIPDKLIYRKKTTTLNTEGLKRGTKRLNMKKQMDLPFYLAFLTGIYLFKFNNKNRKALCEICPRQNKNKFYKTKCVKLHFYKCVHFLYYFDFSLLFESIISFPMSFLLLYLSSHLDSLHRYPNFPHFLHFHPNSRPRF